MMDGLPHWQTGFGFPCPVGLTKEQAVSQRLSKTTAQNNHSSSSSSSSKSNNNDNNTNNNKHTGLFSYLAVRESPLRPSEMRKKRTISSNQSNITATCEASNPPSPSPQKNIRPLFIEQISKVLITYCVHCRDLPVPQSKQQTHSPDPWVWNSNKIAGHC